jgi:hypothetical protein
MVHPGADRERMVESTGDDQEYLSDDPIWEQVQAGRSRQAYAEPSAGPDDDAPSAMTLTTRVAVEERQAQKRKKKEAQKAKLVAQGEAGQQKAEEAKMHKHQKAYNRYLRLAHACYQEMPVEYYLPSAPMWTPPRRGEPVDAELLESLGARPPQGRTVRPQAPSELGRQSDLDIITASQAKDTQKSIFAVAKLLGLAAKDSGESQPAAAAFLKEVHAVAEELAAAGTFELPLRVA